MILAGDIGGTNARLAVIEQQGQGFRIVSEHDYPSKNYKALEDAVAEFLKTYQPVVESACFAVAGPVVRGKAVGTNIPWVVEAKNLAALVGMKRISLINDLEALAYGLTALPSTDLVTLQEGAQGAYGNWAVVAAGTGLGEAGLLWAGARAYPITSEGGHSDFAPRNELEVELFRFLSARYGHVSVERILSGPGMRNVYDFFSLGGAKDGVKEPKAHKDAITGSADPSAEISKHAISGQCTFCVQVMETFVSIYGAEAGNMALKVKATGGVYIGGGIAPKILPCLQSGTFLKAFIDKGRLKPMMEAMPVRIVTNQKTGLLGSARCAMIESAFRAEQC